MNPALWPLEAVIVTVAGVWQGIRQDFNLLELAMVGACVYAWTKKGWRPRRIPAIRTFRHPALAAAAMIAAAVALRLALIPLLPVPIPIVTDEFSHLLLADTLLHGRVSNPPHPLWRHFESLHILQQPRYVSNYFPGHALFLAAGRIVSASPWAGILAEYALFLAALYWALRGWMPSRWAAFGMVLAAVRFGVASYWVNAYHGGFLPAAGGALIFGAFPRLRKNPAGAQSLILGLIFGLGLAVLASTRPFEGFLFAVPFGLVLLWEMRKRIGALIGLAAAASVVALPAVAGLGLYFERITGSPFVTTYHISQKTYGWPMGFLWTPPPKIEQRHIELQRYYDYEIAEHEKVAGVGGFLEFLTFRLQEYWRFFLGPALTVPLLMLGRMWKRRPLLVASAAGGVVAIVLEGAASPHYLAPATAVIVAIVVEGCRYYDGLRVRLAPLLIAAMAVVIVLRMVAEKAGLPYTQALNYQSWCCRVEGNLDKARMTKGLERIPGNHLVFVKAKTDPNNLFQWVYNDADLDVARIVWARDLGAESNAQLARYYAERETWLVDPNVEPPARVSYSPEAAGAPEAWSGAASATHPNPAQPAPR
ncbi:MAG TPA: hypothetical protein VGR73_14195 [Bryobacteraceae bacterium]|nr:hypothetical protein [Bryobacteraceae bacterium]